jgi:hypothetical protein
LEQVLLLLRRRAGPQVLPEQREPVRLLQQARELRVRPPTAQ